MELGPGLGVVAHEGGTDGLLGDDEVGADLGIGTALEIPEIAAGEVFHVGRDVVVVVLAAEDVLLLQGIAFTQGLDDVFSTSI
jgi:hypothetical protein